MNKYQRDVKEFQLTNLTFVGTVVGIHPSLSLRISPRDRPDIHTFVALKTIFIPRLPSYLFYYEVKDVLRKQFLGHKVEVSQARGNETIRRLQDNLEIGALLVKSGLALCKHTQKNSKLISSQMQTLLDYQEIAKKKGLGVHDPCLRYSWLSPKIEQPTPQFFNTPCHQSLIDTIVNSRVSLRFCVENISSSFVLTGLLMPTMTMIRVVLLGYTLPAKDSRKTNALARLNAKLINRVVTVFFLNFDTTQQAFVGELRSEQYNKFFNELVDQNLLFFKSIEAPVYEKANLRLVYCFSNITACQIPKSNSKPVDKAMIESMEKYSLLRRFFYNSSRLEELPRLAVCKRAVIVGVSGGRIKLVNFSKKTHFWVNSTGVLSWRIKNSDFLSLVEHPRIKNGTFSVDSHIYEISDTLRKALIGHEVFYNILSKKTSPKRIVAVFLQCNDKKETFWLKISSSLSSISDLQYSTIISEPEQINFVMTESDDDDITSSNELISACCSVIQRDGGISCERTIKNLRIEKNHTPTILSEENEETSKKNIIKNIEESGKPQTKTLNITIYNLQPKNVLQTCLQRLLSQFSNQCLRGVIQKYYYPCRLEVYLCDLSAVVPFSIDYLFLPPTPSNFAEEDPSSSSLATNFLLKVKDFLEYSLSDRDCEITITGVLSSKNTLTGHISIPRSQLPLRWLSHEALSYEKGIITTTAIDVEELLRYDEKIASEEEKIDIVQHLISQGLTAFNSEKHAGIETSDTNGKKASSVLTQTTDRSSLCVSSSSEAKYLQTILDHQEQARKKRLGLWHPVNESLLSFYFPSTSLPVTVFPISSSPKQTHTLSSLLAPKEGLVRIKINKIFSDLVASFTEIIPKMDVFSPSISLGTNFEEISSKLKPLKQIPDRNDKFYRGDSIIIRYPRYIGNNTWEGESNFFYRARIAGPVKKKKVAVEFLDIDCSFEIVPLGCILVYKYKHETSYLAPCCLQFTDEFLEWNKKGQNTDKKNIDSENIVETKMEELYRTERDNLDSLRRQLLMETGDVFFEIQYQKNGIKYGFCYQDVENQKEGCRRKEDRGEIPLELKFYKIAPHILRLNFQNETVPFYHEFKQEEEVVHGKRREQN